jgi:flavodoxin
MAKRCAVVFYSLSGNTRLVAQAIADEVNGDQIAELVELRLKRPMPEGLMGFMRGGFEAFFRVRSPLLPLETQPADAVASCDLLFVGTPTWAGNMAPAVRSFLHDQRLAGKQGAFFATCADSPGRALEEMRELARSRGLADAGASCAVLGDIALPKPLEETAATVEKTLAWTREMLAKAR